MFFGVGYKSACNFCWTFSVVAPFVYTNLIYEIYEIYPITRFKMSGLEILRMLDK
jgi:hypothetical protein